MLRVTEKISQNHGVIALGLAMVAGLGVILMIAALAVGVIQGSSADSNAIGLLFAGGLVLFVLGVVSWFAVVQPQKHFDDINVPMDTGHHSEPHEEGHAETSHAEHHG